MPWHWQLGLLAGITIFLGLPVAVLPQVTARTRAFLNALSTGILLFLLVEILGKVLEEVEEAVEHAAEAGTGIAAAWPEAALLVAGVGLGLLGLVWFERTFIATRAAQPTSIERPPAEEPAPRPSGQRPPLVDAAPRPSGQRPPLVDAAPRPSGQRARQLALMIAIGIGLHNFGEGLAIGQEHAVGATRLAWLLAVGFGLHNAAEGFGIAAPLAGVRPTWGFLGLLGLIGGGPTVVGAILGGAWVSKASELFCLSLAAGTILYVVGELLHIGRQLKREVAAHVGLLAGFFLAFATELVIHLAG